jgi:D-glycerate 3-kinase
MRAGLAKTKISAQNVDSNMNNAQEQFTDWHDIAGQVLDRLAQDPDRYPKVIAIAGSQGSGKSTLARILAQALNAAGRTAESVSLDDFYLTRQQRVDLAARVHPLLRTRGVPGTHDTQWLLQVLQAMTGATNRITLPQFDKAKDDRVGQRQVSCDVLVLEGWCLGVQRQSPQALVEPVNDLERIDDSAGVWRTWVNEQIQSSYQPLWSAVDYWLHLQPPGFEQVLQWRGQQEQQLAVADRMDEAELKRFVEHYERLTRWQWASTPPGPGLRVQLKPDHGVEHIEALANR